MRVLITSQYFTPEIGATQTRVHAFARGLAERGHDVEVVCEIPNHPQGRIYPAYRGRIVRRRRLDGFSATWVWVRTRPEKTTRDRIAFYASYAALATAWGMVTRRPEVVFASSPPLPVGAAGAAIAAWHRVPWILDVRDLWPEAAVALGELSNPRALALAERLERFLYADAAAVTTVTAPFVRAIAARAPADTSIHLLPNGTTPLWVDAARVPGDRRAAGLDPDRFIWTFAGNAGLAQGLDTAIEAAALLDDRFQFLILGEGAMRRRLEVQAEALPPGRVVFRDQVPAAEAARVLRASDALLVSLAADPALAAFVPSKLFDCCAVGRPVILAAAGEPQRLAAEAGAALPVPPGEAEALAAAVRRLEADSALSERIADAGRRFGAANLREQQVARLEDVVYGVRAQRSVGRSATPHPAPH